METSNQQLPQKDKSYDFERYSERKMNEVQSKYAMRQCMNLSTLPNLDSRRWSLTWLINEQIEDRNESRSVGDISLGTSSELFGTALRERCLWSVGWVLFFLRLFNNCGNYEDGIIFKVGVRQTSFRLLGSRDVAIEGISGSQTGRSNAPFLDDDI